MRARLGRVPRLYVEAQLSPHARLELPENAAHHAARVLRLREGDAVLLFDGRGGEYEAVLSMPGRGQVLAAIGPRRDVERESPLAMTLVQGVSSGEKMDFTIQKAVELGVVAIQPVLAEKSLVRLSAEREEKKLAHWKRVAVAACEQCGRNRVPAIRNAVPVDEYCRMPVESSMRLLLSPEGETGLREMAPKIGLAVTIAAGPEAGFNNDEERTLERAGFVPVRLGRRILRTETAALAALAALNALAGDF
ncbi:MAG: 16S rRNA (uracil(1498)-N(3))-methyltransferase [Candidatus Parcubacteria bacterium]|nr:16S rRNA (uracil(1498)-N(3))-methyltransferase [Burkholderiales bacterium]